MYPHQLDSLSHLDLPYPLRSHTMVRLSVLFPPVTRAQYFFAVFLAAFPPVLSDSGNGRSRSSEVRDRAAEYPVASGIYPFDLTASFDKHLYSEPLASPFVLQRSFIGVSGFGIIT